MTNPIIEEAYNAMRIDHEKDINYLIIVYDTNAKDADKRSYCSESWADGTKNFNYINDAQKVLDAIEDLCGIRFSMGTDRLTVYNKETHEKINGLRLFLPMGFLQIEYEDERENISCSLEIQEIMRDKFELIDRIEF